MKLPGKKGWLYAVAFVFVIVVFAYLLLTYTRRVDGVSMKPTLESGDLVIIQPVSITDIHIGDIIVYGPPCTTGESVIHRVVGGNAETGFYTQGDDRATNPETDQQLDIARAPITQACLVGKVVFIIPYIERLASLPYGLNYIIAAAIFVVIIVSEVFPGPPAEERSGDEDGVPGEPTPSTDGASQGSSSREA